MLTHNLRSSVFLDNNGNLRAGFMPADIKKLTVYWLDGKREVIEGLNVGDALQRAGYGHGALRAIDFIANGEDNDYNWTDGRWVKKAGS